MHTPGQHSASQQPINTCATLKTQIPCHGAGDGSCRPHASATVSTKHTAEDLTIIVQKKRHTFALRLLFELLKAVQYCRVSCLQHSCLVEEHSASSMDSEVCSAECSAAGLRVVRGAAAKGRGGGGGARRGGDRRVASITVKEIRFMEHSRGLCTAVEGCSSCSKL